MGSNMKKTNYVADKVQIGRRMLENLCSGIILTHLRDPKVIDRPNIHKNGRVATISAVQ